LIIYLNIEHSYQRWLEGNSHIALLKQAKIS